MPQLLCPFYRSNPKRLQQIAARKEKSRDLIFWLRKSLAKLAWEGDGRAKALLETLPEVESPKG